jgi:threonine synthase
LCLNAVYQTDGWAAHASDRNFLSIAKQLREAEGLSVLPASTAGLIALLERHQKEPQGPDRYVVLLTGRRA